MSQRSASGVLPLTGSHDRLPMTARIGIVIAALLGLADIAFGAAQLDPDRAFPNVVSIFLIAAGIGTLAAVPFAWRGARWARWLIVALRLLSAMTGLPAFFVTGIPAAFVVAAAGGIVLALLVAVLMLMKIPATSFIATLTLLPGAFAAVRLIRLTSPVLSVWTAAFLIPGYLGMTSLLATDAVAMAGTDLKLDPGLVTQLNTAVLALPTMDILLSIFILGHIVGVVLVGVAAYRGRLMPRLVAILLTVSQPLHLAAVLLGSPWLDLTAWGLTAVGMGYLAKYLMRLHIDQWEPRTVAQDGTAALSPSLPRDRI